MPDPSDYDNEDDWMAACMSARHDEGMEHDQAVASCMNQWRERDKNAVQVTRAWSTLEIKSVDAEQRTIDGLATTPAVDRIGDIVESMGAIFTLPLPLLWQHKHDQPVGHVTVAQPSKAGISIRAKFAKVDEPGELKNTVDKAWQAVKAGLVRGLSIGFSPKEWEPLGKTSNGYRFTKWSWHELSLVTIPANQEATIQLVRSLDTTQAASGHTTPTNRPGASGNGSFTLKSKERTTMAKTIAEQITALEAKRTANEARMSEIMSKAMDDGRSTDESERSEFDDLEAEVATIDGDLKRFKSLERVNLAKAVPVSAKTVEDGTQARAGSIQVRAPQLPPGIPFARVVKCVGMARGSLSEAADIAAKTYPDDPRIANILKASVMAGTTTDSTWAGPLVSAEGAVFADFLEWLRPQTILGKFGTGGVPGLRSIPFRVPIGMQTSGGAGYWVGEGQAKPLTRFDFSRTTLQPLKVANICVVTEELLRSAALPAETLLRDQLAAALRERLDTDFIDPAKAAVAGISPASITNGVTPIASSGVTGDAVRADLVAMMAPFIDSDNPPTGGVWIMGATTALSLSLMTNALGQAEFPGITMNGGTFAGMPVIVSEFVGTSGGSPNTRYVWLVNASQVFLADEGGINVDMSREASLQMDNAPTMNVGEMGSPTAPVATSVVSLWQTNAVGFRAERTINWALARTTAVAGLSGVVWGT